MIKNYWKVALIILFITATLSLSAYPSVDYDWRSPINNVSPIGIALGGINQTYPEDFGAAEENPALLGLRNGTYFSATFRSNRMENKSLTEILVPTYLLKSKQFTYYTFSGPNFGASFQPIVSINDKTETDSTLSYHDLYLNTYTVTLAAKDEEYTKLTLGFNLKLINGRQVYHQHRKVDQELILEEFVDDKAIGYSTDMGLTYAHNTILVGLTLKDLFSQIYWDDRPNNHLRKRYSLGLGYFNENSTFQLATQGRLNNSNHQTYHLGYGYGLNFGNATTQSLGFKAGLFSKNFKSMDNIFYTFGFGYSISVVRVDFSVISNGFNINNTDYLFSITLGK